MNPWTDDDLGALLTDTFASREPLADPDVARRVATDARAVRRWSAYVAAAAAVVLVAGISTAVAVHRDPGTAPTQHPTTGPTSSQTPSTAPTVVPVQSSAENAAAAAAEAQRFADSPPVPGDATRLAGEPADWQANGLAVPGTADPSLTRTTWWSIPEGVQGVRAYLESHDPPGATHEDNDGSTSTGRGPTTFDLTYAQTDSPEPDAYLAVQLVVAWQRHGSGTYLRADVYTAARAARDTDSLVSGAVRTVRVVSEGPPRHERRLTSPGDDAAIAVVVDTVNGLRGALQGVARPFCPAVLGPVRTDTVTVQTDEATWTFLLQDHCGQDIHVTRDGTPIDTQLDPGDLEDEVDRLLTGSAGTP